MEEPRQATTSVSRRGFLKLLTVTLGTSLGVPFLSSCASQKQNEYEVDIVIQENDIHYSPATLTIPRGATVTWLNKSYYSQSATCDPNKAGKGGVANLPPGTQPWDSGILYPGQRFSKTFDTAGTYVYFSQARLSPNTVGTIIVK